MIGGKKRGKSESGKKSGDVTMFDVKTYCRHSSMNTYYTVIHILVMIHV